MLSVCCGYLCRYPKVHCGLLPCCAGHHTLVWVVWPCCCCWRGLAAIGWQCGTPELIALACGRRWSALCAGPSGVVQLVGFKTVRAQRRAQAVQTDVSARSAKEHNRGSELVACGAGRMVCTAAVHRLQHPALWREQPSRRTSAHGVLKNTTEALSHPNEPRRVLASLINCVVDVSDSLVVAAAWRCRHCRAWRRGEKRLIEPMAVMTTMW